MSLFRYTAIDASGTAVTGELTASNAEELRSDLEAKGLRIESIELCDDVESQDEPPRKQAKLSTAQLHELGEHIVDLTRAELPLSQGLDEIIREMPSGSSRRAMQQVARQLRAGDDIETILAAHGAPSDLQTLVQVGVRTGRMAEVLERYLTLRSTVTELRRRAMVGLCYSAVLVAACIGLVLFLLCWFVPQIETIFEGFDAELPASTLLLIGISDLVVGYGHWFALTVFLLVVVVWVVIQLCVPDFHRRRLVCSIPIVGPLIHWAALARFSHLLAILIETEIPLEEALKLAGEGCADARIRHESQFLAKHVQAGHGLVTSVFLPGFPAHLLDALRTHNDERVLPDTLHSVGVMLEQRLHVSSSCIAIVCEPLVVILIGIIVAGVAIPMYLPFLGLLSGVNDLS